MSLMQWLAEKQKPRFMAGLSGVLFRWTQLDHHGVNIPDPRGYWGSEDEVLYIKNLLDRHFDFPFPLATNFANGNQAASASVLQPSHFLYA